MNTEKKYVNFALYKAEQSIEDYRNGKYDAHYAGMSSWDWYEKVPDPENWLPCPICGLRPKVWEFDNGRYTMCGCTSAKLPDNPYHHFSICAESIRSVMHRSHNGQSMLEYDRDGLRKNWNEWVQTGNIVFDRGKEYKKGKW